MLSLLAAAVLMAGTAQAGAPSTDSLDAQTAVFVTADPAEFALPFVRPRQPNNVWRWVRMRDREFNDRFAFAEMNGYDDGLLVELERSCRELFRSSGAVPLFKDAMFRINGQLCQVRDIYAVPDEAAARALAINIMVRHEREAGEVFPEDPFEAAQLYVERANAD